MSASVFHADADAHLDAALDAALDVEAIERATVAAVSPESTEEIDGWLLAFDHGVVGRAKSAVPLTHSPSAAGVAGATEVIAKIERCYEARGFPPMFRIPDVAAFHPLAAALATSGYRADPPSLVQLARATDVRGLSANPSVTIAARPDAAWGKVFLGEGFDPVDGVSRVEVMSRARDAVYASVPDSSGAHGGRMPEAIAVGAASFAFGWASIHAMRTALGARRKGLAGRIMAALAQQAIDRGYDRIFLQVEENNPGARSLYARGGFTTAWRYTYWRR